MTFLRFFIYNDNRERINVKFLKRCKQETFLQVYALRYRK